MDKEINKYIRFYYIYWALVGTWFATAVWIFFSRKYLSLEQIGLMDALIVAIGVCAEVPSGALADRFGRKKVVTLGVLLAGFGFTLWGFATAGWMILAGNILYIVGTAFQSGADDAMMYDYLKGRGKEDLWPKVSVNKYIIARASFVVALFIGGIAFTYLDRLPLLLRGFTFFLMVIPLYKLAVVDKYQHTHVVDDVVESYWSNLKTGIKELFKTKIVWIVPIYLLCQGVSYGVFTAGLLRPLLYEHSGLDIKYHSAAMSVALAMTVTLLLILKRYEAKVYKPVSIFVLSALCAVGFAVNLGSSVILSLVGLTLIQICTYIVTPMLSVQLNKIIDSKYRATTLSTANFMETAFYVIAAPIVGLMVGKGMMNEVILLAIALIAFGLLLSVMIYRRSY